MRVVKLAVDRWEGIWDRGPQPHRQAGKRFPASLLSLLPRGGPRVGPPEGFPTCQARKHNLLTFGSFVLRPSFTLSSSHLRKHFWAYVSGSIFHYSYLNYVPLKRR